MKLPLTAQLSKSGLSNKSMPSVSKPTILVVFGISGDLSHRYLLPALAELSKARKLSPNFKLWGISRRNLKTEEVFNTPKLLELSKKVEISLHQMNMDSQTDFRVLKQTLKTYKPQQVVFYFAVPPESVANIISRLGQAGLNQSHVKLLLEKPFGTDYKSAKQVIGDTAKYFSEYQVYRIDHYLAKEMAQNISVFLGGNILFRDVWSNKFISSIDIVVAEKIGIEGRVKFYEQTGALRDIVQNHALQLAALTIAEPCSSVFEFEELPQRRYKALKSFKLKGIARRAQYSSYKKEVGQSRSKTETFVELTVESSLKKWKGVPIRITTGKSLNEKLTEIQINFTKTHEAQANRLVLRVQPREGIDLDLWVKEPGYERKLKKLNLEFDYRRHFKHLPDAYEQVLVEALRSNKHLFASSQEIVAAWKILQPILNSWSKSSSKPIKTYANGSSIKEVTAGWQY